MARVVIPEQPRVGYKRKYQAVDCKFLAIPPAVVAEPPTKKSRPNLRNFGAQAAAERNRSNPTPILSFGAQLLVNAQTAAEKRKNKVACGLAEKPKDPILDIDAADMDDELSAVEYIQDMHRFYKRTENDRLIRDYMGSQIDIDETSRAIIVDWLVDIHMRFDLMPESLFLAVNIVDRFLSVTNIPRRLLQLVGMSSMLIACKYEETYAPHVTDLKELLDDCFLTKHVLMIEKEILEKLEWFLSVPTPYVFLARYIKASFPADKELENMVFFYAELGLMNYTTVLNFSPSLLSASAVYAARCTLFRIPLWTGTLKHHSGYSEDQLGECAKLLIGYHSGVAENKLKAVSQKYSNPKRGGVALYPPARHLNLSLDK